MATLLPPHGGGELKSLLVPQAQRAKALAAAQGLRKVPMTSREVSDLVLFAMAAYTPLEGFMSEADWLGVCKDMKLANGLFWPIPVTLSATRDVAGNITEGEEIALIDSVSGEIMGTMRVMEKYAIDKALECRTVFLTTEEEHPGVAKVMAQADINLAGPVKVFSEGGYPEKYPGLYLRAWESRALFAAKGWSRIAAFQTRNPMHRSHEHLCKIAIEICDGVFIHQVLGALKPGDIPAETRTRAIQAMVETYFVPGTAIQAGYPIEMRYAGPREALLHAVVRQNFGCSHLIVGRDHAGVGDYYGLFDAQKIFDEIPAEALKLKPLNIDLSFFCTRCGGMATARTCPHTAEDKIEISGTLQREMLSKGVEIAPEFSRPEVIKVLREFYRATN
jgi:sulfate adenylyltransferase